MAASVVDIWWRTIAQISCRIFLPQYEKKFIDFQIIWVLPQCRYNLNGFVEELPNLPKARFGHACAPIPTPGNTGQVTISVYHLFIRKFFHLFITCLSTLFYNLFITCFVTCLLPFLSPVLSTSLSPVFHLFITCLITLFIHLCCRPLSWPEAPMVGGNTPHLWSVSSLEKQPGLRNGHFPEHFLSRGLLLLEGKCGWWGGKQNTRASGMRWQLHQRDDRKRVYTVKDLCENASLFPLLVNPTPRYLSGLLKSGLKNYNWAEAPGDIMLSSPLAVRTLNACPKKL